PYAYAEWRLRRVGVDYHIEGEAHFYSVPYRFARREVEGRLTPRTVEGFLKGERIAAPLRSSGNHHHTTVPEHMPSSHRRYADWTVQRIRQAATAIGNGSVMRVDPGAPSASRTGLPFLPGYCSPAAAVWRRSSRSGGHARHRDRHPDLQLG